MNCIPIFYGKLSDAEKLESSTTAMIVVTLFLGDKSADYILNIAVQLMVLGLHKMKTDEPDRVVADVGDTAIHAYSDFKAFMRENTEG